MKTQDGRVLKGRQYSWGVAEVENEDHCDFKKLRSILIRTHMLDLIHTTEEMHYEAYRAQQMETRKFGEARPRKLDNPKFKEEEESLRKRFTEQVKVEENRFRAWEQKLISERDRLNKDLESTHAAYVALDTQHRKIWLICPTASSSWRWSWSRCKAAFSEATDVVRRMQWYHLRERWNQKSWMGLMDGEGSYHSIRLVVGLPVRVAPWCFFLERISWSLFPLRSTRLIQCPYLEHSLAISLFRNVPFTATPERELNPSYPNPSSLHLYHPSM